MATTLQNLLDEFRIETRDPDGILFQDEDAIYALNSAYVSCYSFVLKQNKDYFVSSASVSFVADQRAYPLPSDFVRMKRVEYVRDNNRIPLFEKIRGVDAVYIGPSLTSAAFANFTYEFENETVVFEPTPQYSQSSVVTLTYYPAPVEIADITDEIHVGFKDHWRKFIVLEAVWSAYSTIEALGQRVNKDDVQTRLEGAKDMIAGEVALRTLSPRIRRRRRYFN